MEAADRNKIRCVCPCQREFVPKTESQIYYESACRFRFNRQKFPKLSSSVIKLLSEPARDELLSACARVAHGTARGEVAKTSRDGQISAPGANQLFAPGDLLTTYEVASLLRVSRWALSYWRARGDGPPFLMVKGGTVRYSRKRLVEFLTSRERQGTGSTAKYVCRVQGQKRA